MVDEFPIRHFQDDPKAYSGLLGRDMRHTYSDPHSLRQEFLTADTAERMQEFMEKHDLCEIYAEYSDLYAESSEKSAYSSSDRALNGMLAMRAVLTTVLSVKALIDSGTATLKNLAEYGIEFSTVEVYKRPNEAYMPLEDDVLPDLSPEEYLERYGGHTEEVPGFTFDFDFQLRERDEEYSNEEFVVSDWYHHSLRDSNPQFGTLYTYWEDVGIGFRLPLEIIHEEHGSIPVEECAPIVAQLFVDAAISAHLGSVRIHSVNSQEVIDLGDFEQTIWYSLFDAFRGGRVGRCDVCARPYISQRERGKPRRYCSDRCTKRAQRMGISGKRSKHKEPSDTPSAADKGCEKSFE
jgi:hypothetical protein